MSGNNLVKHGSRSVFVAGLLVLLLAAGLRYGVIENGLLPRDCAVAGEDTSLACGLKWLLVQTFHQQRMGWLSLVCGGAAFLLSCRKLAWAGWLSGIGGLLLYSYDYAAVGGLLSLLVLLRARQNGYGEYEAGEQPGDGLRIGRLR
ncbi:MAG: hypothetical protein RBT39_18070 [Azoarcus sp.]|nr:hypothetical protein [Azoarcus sp.]MDX9839471.1 hypothetical protein [Azoarcus sp.]